MELIQSANVALRFILELCALIAFGYYGFRTGTGRAAQIALGIGVPLIVAVMWIMFGAPGAAYELGDPWHLGLEIVFFGGAAVALAAAGRRPLALVFGTLAVINRALMYLWGQ
jgi:hypothetical protein